MSGVLWTFGIYSRFYYKVNNLNLMDSDQNDRIDWSLTYE
jgi:hypothetical protein